MKHTAAIVVLAGLLPVLGLSLGGCAGSAEPAAEPRYPEKRRPPPLRSASDGEIMGADNVAPEDRLEASPTNERPAPGWVMEDGKLMPEKEAQHRKQAHQRSGYAEQLEAGASDADCDPNATTSATTAGTQPAGNEAAGAADGTRKRKPPCPPQPQPQLQPQVQPEPQQRR